MLRAAIYARFSSENQNEKSTEDQITLCRELCDREGFQAVAVFEDPAISGSSAANRPGYQKMMRAAESKSFDVLVAEDIDRISRAIRATGTPLASVSSFSASLSILQRAR
jgi:site-specific DNA recombinase